MLALFAKIAFKEIDVNALHPLNKCKAKPFADNGKLCAANGATELSVND